MFQWIISNKKSKQEKASVSISEPSFMEDDPTQDIDEFDPETFADEDETESEDDDESYD